MHTRDLNKGSESVIQGGISQSRVISITTHINSVIENNIHLDIRGILDQNNYGSPASSNIIRTISKGRSDIPQAWPYIINGKQVWFYNYLGAIEEESYLQGINLDIYLPTIEELVYLSSNGNNCFVEKEENGLFGFRGANSGRILQHKKLGGLWSGTSSGSKNHAHAFLMTNNMEIRGTSNNIEFRGIGFQIKFLRK